jgi:hypothetical protein
MRRLLSALPTKLIIISRWHGVKLIGVTLSGDPQSPVSDEPWVFRRMRPIET